jgi:diguanylate cyclase (GGDEF)-like protein
MRFREHASKMSAGDAPFADERASAAQGDLPRRIAAGLLERLDSIVADAVAVVGYSTGTNLDSDNFRRIGHRVAQLLASTVRDSRVDPRASSVTDLYTAVLDCSLALDQLFTFTYLIERSALDELASDDGLRAALEPWPRVAQLVRRASFDLLAAYVERAQLERRETAAIDRLTTLHTRALFDAALDKEIDRASRFGGSFSMILFDVDHLSDINQEHGYGVGDKILERLGILIRTFFRQHDWVARHSEDSIAVLLSPAEAGRAHGLAERVRATVQERLAFVDHRTDRPVTVTVSAAVINAAVGVGDVIDTQRLITEAEAAVDRAKRQGRNRVVRIDGYRGAPSPRMGP